MTRTDALQIYETDFAVKLQATFGEHQDEQKTLIKEDVTMKKQAMNYDAAVAAFHKRFEDKRVLPEQPNNELSELRGTTWYLRNVHGPLARVMPEELTT